MVGVQQIKSTKRKQPAHPYFLKENQMALKKAYDETFIKGVIDEDQLNDHLKILNSISHKPTEDESDLVNGDIGDLSYSVILEKKVRIVVYVEE